MCIRLLSAVLNSSSGFSRAAVIIGFSLCTPCLAADVHPCAQATTQETRYGVTYERQSDVVYGHKFGMALTMDVMKPAPGTIGPGTGRGVIFVVSGGWTSLHEYLDHETSREGFTKFLKHGYTVFAVLHGCQKFSIPDAIADMNRSVRFVRHHAADFGIDPEHIGIAGWSAGGHLSLMIATAGSPGVPDAADPVDRESSRVQAVACFFPPTDFLNYGAPGENALGRGLLKGLPDAFEFTEWDKNSNSFVVIQDEARRVEIGKQISPITHVSSDDPPTFIIHGDGDPLVPLQQAQIFIEALKKAGVECELVVKKSDFHWWPEVPQDTEKLADWFDQHLAPQGSNSSGTSAVKP